MRENKSYELTSPQKSIWITEQYYKGTSINNICGTGLINEKVDFKILKQAILEVMKKNDIFKIKLYMENS